MSTTNDTSKVNDLAEGAPSSRQHHDDDVFRPVPPNERQSWVGFLAILCGAWASLAALSVGVQAGLGLTAWKASLAFLVGYLLCMVLAMFIAEIGRKRRVSTAVLAIAPFSRHGAALPGLLIFVTGGFSIGIQVDILTRVGMSMSGLTLGEGFSLTRGVISALLCAVMMTSSYLGIKYIKWVSWAAIPIFFLVLIVGVVYLSTQHGSGVAGIMTHEAAQLTFSSVVMIALGLYSGFAVLMSDLSRFVESRKGLMTALLIGFVVSTLVPVAGVYFGAASEATVYWAVFTQFGVAFTVFALIGLFLAQWSTNDANAFAAGLGLSTGVRSLPRQQWQAYGLNRRQATLAVGVVAIVLAFLGSGAIGFISGFISYLGATFLPLGGVLLGHYYVVERSGRPVATRGIAGFTALVTTAVVTILDLLPYPLVFSVFLSMLIYCLVYYGIERRLFDDQEYDASDMASTAQS